MKTPSIRALGMFAIAACACMTVWFVCALQPTTPTAFAVFGAWLLSPHAAMAFVLLVLPRKRGAPAHWWGVAIAVCVGGILFLADRIFWHADPQGGIAVLMTPLLQAAALAVLLTLSAIAFRHSPGHS